MSHDFCESIPDRTWLRPEHGFPAAKARVCFYFMITFNMRSINSSYSLAYIFSFVILGTVLFDQPGGK